MPFDEQGMCHQFFAWHDFTVSKVLKLPCVIIVYVGGSDYIQGRPPNTSHCFLWMQYIKKARIHRVLYLSRQILKSYPNFNLQNASGGTTAGRVFIGDCSPWDINGVLYVFLTAEYESATCVSSNLFILKNKQNGKSLFNCFAKFINLILPVPTLLPIVRLLIKVLDSSTSHFNA